ncbi:Uncharacterised protein [Mycobacteroides abscessus subsp. abscessus]|nr:Uncharacterised protein [Mycobacteroides abscessus subsp. abscessus]
MAREACGQSLGQVDGRGVSEGDIGFDVVSGQGQFLAGADVGHYQRAVGAYAIDGVAVAVAHEIVTPDDQPSAVLSGLDDVAGRGSEFVRQDDLAADAGDAFVNESVAAGARVEFVDHGVGGRQQQTVASGFEVAAPGVVGHVSRCSVGADMDPVVVDVEAQSGRVTGAQREGGGGLRFGVEPHQFGQGQRVGFGGDIAKHSASRDRSELTVVPDESNAGTLGESVADHRIQIKRSGLADFVDDDHGFGVDIPIPGRDGSGPTCCGVHVFCDGVRRCVEVSGKLNRRRGGRCQPDHIAARGAPRVR